MNTQYYTSISFIIPINKTKTHTKYVKVKLDKTKTYPEVSIQRENNLFLKNGPQAITIEINFKLDSGPINPPIFPLFE